MMRKTLFVALASAGLLAACGGGGSDSSTANAANVTLSGTAAKGLMANADVGVYAVNADGSIAGTPLVSTTTDNVGHYSLSFAGTKDVPVVVRVSAKADGSTFHADEVSGALQALPAGFVMRSLVVPSASGAVTTSASITPFSEMAVAAAANASGGVTAANAAQAVSTVTQLLGFNPSTVNARTVDDAAGSDEQKLAVMLTAVSQLANSGALGCSSGEAGDKVKCVVEKMRDSSSKDSIKLGSGSGDDDVSGKLADAVNTVMADDNVRSKVDSAVLTGVVANLGCTSSCTSATVGTTPTGPSATATAIAAAKQLFSQIKSDWSAMFSRGGANSIAGGAVNQEAVKIKTALNGVQVPAEMLGKDLGVLLMGIDLYHDYKAGRALQPQRGRGDGRFVSGDRSVPDNDLNAVGCTLFQDAAGNVTATTPENAAYIGCAARFYASRSFVNETTTTTEWRHTLFLTPGANGVFDYAARARRRSTSCSAGNCDSPVNATLQLDANGTPLPAFTGTLSPILTGDNGSITSFTLTGDLPAAFEPGSNTLVGHHHAVNMSGTQTEASANAVSATLAGTLIARDSAGATVSTLRIKPGSTLGTSPISFDADGNGVQPGSASAISTGGSTLSLATLDVVFGNAGAEFEGVVSITGTTWDKSGTSSLPTQATISGALRNIGESATLEFFKGQLTATITGYANYDATLPSGVDNSYGMSASFVGSVTATGRPTLEFTLGTANTEANRAAGVGARQATLQYRTLVGGVPRLVVALTADRVANSNDTAFTLTEASANLAMRWTGRPDTVGLFVGDSNRIGTLVAGSGLLTFSDDSFISLDIGL